MERLRAILDASADGLVVLDHTGAITVFNRAAEQIFGRPAGAVFGQTLQSLIVEPLALSAPEAVVTGRHASGRLLTLTLRCAPIPDGETVVTVQDTAEELQARESHKLEAVSRLAGGLAHDFNNMLTVIELSTRLLEDEFAGHEAALPYLKDIKLTVDKAANLTRQLLMFTRQHALQPVPLFLHEVLAEMTLRLAHLLQDDVTLVTDFSPAPAVLADRSMLEQVVMNLAMNAREAMATRGTLTLRTSTEEGFACLTVVDTGVGMHDAVRTRIFEPFFTTKEAGRGSGLGLSTVHGIVRLHHGRIEVESEPANGSTFRILLPAAALPPAVATPEQEGAVGGTETILLVEDQASLRRLTRRMLERLGYRVEAFANAHEALLQWPHLREQVDLLLTDVVMPGGMSGKELARQLLRDQPRLKAVLCSGYDPGGRAGEDSGTPFLSKPFAPEKLARIVRQTLDSAKAGGSPKDVQV